MLKVVCFYQGFEDFNIPLSHLSEPLIWQTYRCKDYFKEYLEIHGLMHNINTWNI